MAQKTLLHWNRSTYEIPRGNTQDEVNHKVFEALLKRYQPTEPLKVLEIPSGEGFFLETFRKIFPKAELLGGDPYVEPVASVKALTVKKTAEEIFLDLKNQKFDLMVCISGVMCFDGIHKFVRQATETLKVGGHFILTNDNTLTARDRLSFLLFGRVKRFKLLYQYEERNWNIMPIQALWMLWHQNHVELEEVIYAPIKTEDWLTLPIALVLFPFQMIYLATQKSPLTWKQRYRMFPFRSLLARHYILVGKKRA